MTSLNQDDIQVQNRNSAIIMILVGLMLVGIITLIFLHPGLRQWVSREGESLQIIDAIVGLLLASSTYFIHPVWVYFKIDTHPEMNLFNRAINWLKKHRLTIVFTILFVSLIFYITIYIVIATTPVFKITDPKDRTTIISASREITVEGRGAKPGGTVKVYVFDGHQTHQQEGSANIDQKGNWSVDNIVLQTEDYKYIIWAETMIDGVPVRTVNRPHVVRKSSCSVNSFYILVITIFVILILATIGIWIMRTSKRR